MGSSSKHRTWGSRRCRSAICAGTAGVGCVVAAVGIGTVTGGGGYALQQTINGEEIDNGELATSTALGAVGGLIPGGGGNAAKGIIQVGKAGLVLKGAKQAADDWPVISGIVRDAARGKGMFGLGEGTLSQAQSAGAAWVGEGAKLSGDSKALVSADKLRQWRAPELKRDLGKVQSNFESRFVPNGRWQNNGHFDIVGR